MRRYAVVVYLVALLCAPAAFGYLTGEVTLANLVGTTRTTGLLVGDKVFYDFSVVITSGCNGPSGSCTFTYGPWDMSSVKVTGISGGTSSEAPQTIKINSGLNVDNSNVSSAPAWVDFFLQYTVSTVSGRPLINGIGQSYTGGVSNGQININEIASNGIDVVAQSTLTLTDHADPPGEPIQGDQLKIVTPLSTVYITKDIHLTANPGAFTSVSGIFQTAYQVPEPGFYGALALGLSGLLLTIRRKSVSK